MLSGASLTDNANTGIVRLGDGRVVCLTESTKGSIEIDPETLGTIGMFSYTDKIGGLLQAAPNCNRKRLDNHIARFDKPGLCGGKNGVWCKSSGSHWAGSLSGQTGSWVGSFHSCKRTLRDSSRDAIEVLPQESVQSRTYSAVPV